jgi:aspartate kinase
MGGFIGATEEGATTTTMGRGGSDLTATLIGAGISAEEVQVWKDVDGMLTCDPKVMPGGYRLKTISYAEAAAMAKSGAKLLHPDTVSPVIRQRIPIVIRNSRRPDIEGTSIVPSAQSGTNPVKSISCKQDLTILELESNVAGILESLCARHSVPVEFTAVNGSSFFLGVKNSTRLESLAASLESDLACVEARVHSNSAVITLVGQGINSTPGLIARVVATLRAVPVICIPDCESGLKLSLIVPQKVMQRSIEHLHREFFQRVDPGLFARATDHRPSTFTSAARPKSDQSAEIRSFPRAIQA